MSTIQSIDEDFNELKHVVLLDQYHSDVEESIDGYIMRFFVLFLSESLQVLNELEISFSSYTQYQTSNRGMVYRASDDKLFLMLEDYGQED